MNKRWRQIVVPLILAMLALSFNGAAGAEFPFARPSKLVAVFAGHTGSSNARGNHQGARSASGIYEYRFNEAVAKLFTRMKRNDITYKLFAAALNIPFHDRPALVEKSGASALVEIHHDSVQPHIYEKLVRAKYGDPMLAYYRGFSIHVYPNANSIRLAKAIEFQMLSQRLQCAEYHTEDIPGERMKLVDGTKAVYQRENIYVLRNSSIPAVIIECGCIANPQEERLLNEPLYRQRIATAIHQGIMSFLSAEQGRNN